MSGEKTEKPTAKRLKEARREGQVARTPDLGAWLAMLAATYLVPRAAGSLTDVLVSLMLGVTAAIGMFVYASMQKSASAVLLALIVFIAMTASCIISGVSGALIPLGLKRLGADPATASSIFLTTATDVASMGTFLGLATWLI